MDAFTIHDQSDHTYSKIHVKSANPYVEPFFDSGFMNNKADFAPIRWSYKVTREVARRMDCKCNIAHRSRSILMK